MDEFKWSKDEKAAARRAFDRSYERECGTILAEVKNMIERSSSPRVIWEIHDYLSVKRRETDEKYDYRYSVLPAVFARLCSEGWLKESELEGLGAEKRVRIKLLSEL